MVQGARSASCLEDLRRFFGVGRIFVNQRHDNHREDMVQYHVSRRDDLLEVVIPFFQRHPLRSSKREDFAKFARCMEIVASERHRSSTGLADIAEIAQTMNRQKLRSDLIRILRGHTPDALDTGR